MLHTPSVRCLLALCVVLRWSATVAARLSSTATLLEPFEQEIKPSFADVDSYDTCNLSEGRYTMSNLSEIQCVSGKTLKDFTEMNPSSSNKLVLAPGMPVRLVGKGKPEHAYGEWQTKLRFDISPLPGASLYLEGLDFQGKIEVEDMTSSGQSKMSYLTFVNCSVGPAARDAKHLALAKLELDGFQDPSASAWFGWLILRDAALTLQIHDSSLDNGAFVEQSPNFNLWASKSTFDLKGQGFQLVNVTSHIWLEEVNFDFGILSSKSRQGTLRSFQMLYGRHEVHVAGSFFFKSGIEIQKSSDLTLDVSSTRFRLGQKAIVVEGHSSQVDLQDVKIDEFSESGVVIHGFDINVRINHTKVLSKKMSNTAIAIFSKGDAPLSYPSDADVKLDNIQIENARIGAELRAKHLIAKNMHIWHTETGILLNRDCMDEVELEAVKMEDVGTGLQAKSAFRAEDLEIFEAKVTAIAFETLELSQANGVSIWNSSVAVKCQIYCTSLSLDNVLIARNGQALVKHGDTNLQTSSGLIFFNSWEDILAINQASRLPCPIAIALSYLACGLATILSRISLEQHFSGGFETASYGQTRKYVLAGASLLLWIMVVEALVAAFLLQTMSWTYSHQQQVHLKIVKPYANIWLTSLLTLLTAAIIYLYYAVVRLR